MNAVQDRVRGVAAARSARGQLTPRRRLTPDCHLRREGMAVDAERLDPPNRRKYLDWHREKIFVEVVG